MNLLLSADYTAKSIHIAIALTERVNDASAGTL
jgi:hypothetical protein